MIKMLTEPNHLFEISILFRSHGSGLVSGPTGREAFQGLAMANRASATTPLFCSFASVIGNMALTSLDCTATDRIADPHLPAWERRLAEDVQLLDPTVNHSTGRSQAKCHRRHRLWTMAKHETNASVWNPTDGNQVTFHGKLTKFILVKHGNSCKVRICKR
jgi:hypothetical protein